MSSVMGELVFADSDARRAINKATHGPILLELLLALVRHMSNGDSLVVLDAPLLFETGLHHLCATTLVVHTSALLALHVPYSIEGP